MADSGQRSSNNPVMWFLLALAMITMPLGAALDGAAQWIFLGMAAVAIFLCANQVRINNQRNRSGERCPRNRALDAS